MHGPFAIEEVSYDAETRKIKKESVTVEPHSRYFDLFGLWTDELDSRLYFFCDSLGESQDIERITPVEKMGLVVPCLVLRYVLKTTWHLCSKDLDALVLTLSYVSKFTNEVDKVITLTLTLTLIIYLFTKLT